MHSMVVEITPIGIESLRWQFYIIWTVLNGSFVPFTYFLYPETAGRTLEDIDTYFREKPSLLVFRDKASHPSSSLLHPSPPFSTLQLPFPPFNPKYGRS